MKIYDVKKWEGEVAEIIVEHGLDQKTINKYRSKIKKCSQEQSSELGAKLYDLIKSNKYSLEVMNKLILDGADVNYKNPTNGDFPLLLCSRGNENPNSIEGFCMLIRAGADINQTNNYLTTCCMGCARHDNKMMLLLLIHLKANINARCLDGDTAIMSAIRHGNKTCFDFLVSAQAYLNIYNLENQTLNDISNIRGFKFDEKLLVSNKEEEILKPTYEDTQELIEEAKKKIMKLNKN